MKVGDVAPLLRDADWHAVAWRHGSRGVQRARFAAVRVRPAWGWIGVGVRPEDLCAEEWLLLHWPEGEPAPTKAWLSNLPATTPLVALVALARLRWRIERDYREGKGLAGLDHFEGRTWHGLHHHAAFVVLAQQFLARERLAELAAAPAPPPPDPAAPSTLAPAPAPGFPPDDAANSLPPFPHTARTSFGIARAIQQAFARWGLPCCPCCLRQNERPDPIGPPSRRTFDVVAEFCGWAG